MTLYDYCKDYLVNQTNKYFPEITPQLDNYFLPDLYSYIFNVKPGEETMDDVMELLCFILQNRFNLPNVINFKYNIENLRYNTHSFSIPYLCTLDVKSLYNTLKSSICWSSGDKTWNLYCEGIIQGANYLSQFKSFKDYYTYISTQTNKALGELCQIRGIGQAMSRNFLKELGVTSLGKPDVHIEEVFKACDITWKNGEEFDNILSRLALESKVTPYQLDRVIWLICSGRYFNQNKKILNGKYFLRKTFIKHLKEDIGNNTITKMIYC